METKDIMIKSSIQPKYYMIEDIQVVRFNNITIDDKNSVDINSFKNHIYKIKVLNLPPNIEYKMGININDKVILSNESINGVIEINNFGNDILIKTNNKDRLAIYEKENNIKLNKYFNFCNLANVKLYFTNTEPIIMKQCIIIAFVYSLFKTY